jgi:hypothetical protein
VFAICFTITLLVKWFKKSWQWYCKKEFERENGHKIPKKEDQKNKGDKNIKKKKV